MGYANRALIAHCEKWRRAGNEGELARAGKLVDASQDACPHPPEDRRETRFRKDSPTGKYKAGRRCTFCGRCSKILQYES